MATVESSLNLSIHLPIYLLPLSGKNSTMRLTIATLLFTSVFAVSVLAGHNCKCQDDRGQYNELTSKCCGKDPSAGNPAVIYYPGPNHQCTSPYNVIDSGAFVQCCQNEGVGGAYCWD
ncbi:hypothetical protein BOTBODRAFT_190705 [Botryobasidium botryosum FD-172 SS1]|uniref:Uncharacterized protein n=1 Tax=Botryobasidium botryosum (strain FD-172 SS1) TaxID=930990 RepID=A0A067MDX9_BOTB1|nr:hypothetical protein BOTBODRAFT_190705 [Botryobasidium botryosum FD-172 SS1]